MKSDIVMTLVDGSTIHKECVSGVQSQEFDLCCVNSVGRIGKTWLVIIVRARHPQNHPGAWSCTFTWSGTTNCVKMPMFFIQVACDLLNLRDDHEHNLPCTNTSGWAHPSNDRQSGTTVYLRVPSRTGCRFC